MANASRQVLLGFVDEPVTENCSDDACTINKIGGLPDIPNDRDCSPKCPLCGRQAPLLVQIYAPLVNSIYHRTLYVHACISPQCWNKSQSWMCLRRQWVAVEHCDEKQQSMTFIEWCDDADDWGVDPSVEQNDNVTNTNEAIEICTSASAELENSDADNNVVVEPIVLPTTDVIQLLDSRKEIPSDRQNMNLYFEPHYIFVAFEGSSDAIRERAVELLSRYQNNEMVFEKVFDEKKNEGYEKGISIHGDEHFVTFTSTIRKYPGQILRYCRNGGKPLFLYEENEPSTCSNCQGKVVFELQILPSLITYLKLKCGEDYYGSGHFEFGTAVIYTCENNCWNEGDAYKYERVIVQEEKLF